MILTDKIKMENNECMQQNGVVELKKPIGTKYKLIELNGVLNKYAKVSNLDYDTLSKSQWFLNKNGDVVNEHHKLMCDLIIKPTNGFAVKHVNGDKLNNMRTNLKIANYKKILLTDGINETIVDIEDYDWLSKCTWHLNDDGYVENCKKELMHNLVMRRSLCSNQKISQDKHIRKNNRKCVQ